MRDIAAGQIRWGMVAVLAFPIALGAQQRPDSTAADSARTRLAPVTVLGTRSPLSTLRVPLAVSVIQGDQLQRTRGYGLDEVLNTIPGVLAQSRSGNQDVRILIRGFGARGAGDRSNAGTSRGIRVLLDGIPETEPDGRTAFDGIDLASAARIDVVRSNASAIWGNAAGGLINISTVPRFDELLGTLQQSSGSFGLMRTALQGGTRFGAARAYVSFVSSTFDGWREASDSRRSLLNLGLLAPLGNRTDFALYAVGSNNLFHIPGPLTRSQAEANPRQANATYRGRDERRYNRQGRIGATLEHRISDAHEVSGMLYVNPKYLQRSERGTFRDFTRHHVGGNLTYRNRKQFTPTLRHTLLIGADEAFQDGAILFYGLSSTGGRGTDLRDNKREGANNLGVYVQEELGIGDAFTLTLGARYDNITYYNESYIFPRTDASKAFTRVTPKVGLLYALTPTHTVYANAGGGVEAPAGNETDPASTFGQDTVTSLNPLLAPIRSTTYEIGTKQIFGLAGDGFLRELGYDIALYNTDVRNEIVPYRGGRFYFTAGKARRSGAEFSTTLRAAHGLSLQTALTWSDNKYVDYVVDSVHYQRPGRFADFSGNSIVGIPNWMANLSLGVAPAALQGISLHVNAQGVGKYFADDANSVVVPGYGIVGGTLALEDALVLGRGIGLRGFVGVNNLFNRGYLGSAFLNPDVVRGVPIAFEPGMPRNVVLSLSLSAVR